MPDQTWNGRRRTAEDYAARRNFEIKNFGTSSILSPRSARLAHDVGSSSQPQTSQRVPQPGVYTIPNLEATRPIATRRRGQNPLSDISLPQARPHATLPGYTRRDVDTTIELSTDGQRHIQVTEGRDVRTAKRVRISNAGEESDWIGVPPSVDDTLLLGEESESGEEGGEGEVDHEDPWQDVEEGCNPAALIDETGDVRESKRKSYASSVCFLPAFQSGN